MKLTYLLIMSLMIAFAMPMVLAETVTSEVSTEITAAEPTLISENSEVTTTEATIEEDANIEDATIGFGEKARLNLQNWFTFNQEKKAEIELKLAKLSLIEARIAAKNNNSAAMEKALEAHQRILEKVQTRAEKLKESEKDSEKLTGLDRAIEVHNARINNLNNLLANEDLTDEQKVRIEAKLAQAEDVTAGLSGIQARISERIAERTRAGEKPVYASLIEEAKARNMTVTQVAVEKAVAKRAAERALEESEDTEDIESETEDNSEDTSGVEDSGAQTQAGQA